MWVAQGDLPRQVGDIWLEAIYFAEGVVPGFSALVEAKIELREGYDLLCC